MVSMLDGRKCPLSALSCLYLFRLNPVIKDWLSIDPFAYCKSAYCLSLSWYWAYTQRI